MKATFGTRAAAATGANAPSATSSPTSSATIAGCTDRFSDAVSVRARGMRYQGQDRSLRRLSGLAQSVIRAYARGPGPVAWGTDVPSGAWPDLPVPRSTATASPTRRARTCSSTPTTRSTGIRGVPRRSPRAKPSWTARSSCRSATPRATGATSWSASRSRTRRSRPCLNERFVRIKVDREERPDLDQLYMGAVQAMTGQGGWPMSVFLDPGRAAVLRRHVLPGHAAPRHAALPAGARGRSTWRGPTPAGGDRRRERPARRRRSPSSRAARRGRGRRRRPGLEVLDRAVDGHRRPSSTPRTAAGARAPKFPQPMTIELLLRRFAAAATSGRSRSRGATPRRDGRRRHPRPARRRLPPLLDRRALAGAPLRADALRQRPARSRVPARVGAHRRPRYRDAAVGVARLPAARAADGRRRLRGEPGRGHGGRGGRDVRVVRGRASSRARRGRARSRALRGRVRRHGCGQLGGRDDPVAGARRRGARGARSAVAASRSSERLAAARATLLERRGAAAAARPRRQGAGGLERARDRGPRGRGPGAGGERRCRGRRGGRPLPRGGRGGGRGACSPGS